MVPQSCLERVHDVFMDYTYDQLVDRKDLLYIDVRSQQEFNESTIPGAVNIPLFSNEERAIIGTIYKQESPEKARDVGVTMASAKIPAIVSQVKQIAQHGQVVVFCWRGGMRSKTVATLADLMNIPIIRLTGGYRAFRQHVIGCFDRMLPSDLSPLVVLHGMTGVGKTMILHELLKRGEPVLDLEHLAQHRGSAFGGIGLNPANQRQFDAQLFQQLQEVTKAPYLFIEAESRRIGKVYMPEFLFEAKRKGTNIAITASIELRVKRTLAQYKVVDEDLWYQECEVAVSRIEKRFSPDMRKQAREYLVQRQYDPLIEIMMTHYYDPLYRHAMDNYEQDFVTVEAVTIAKAADQIQKIAYGLMR